jgi:hypothetical protein
MNERTPIPMLIPGDIDYENIWGYCGLCDELNTYNRATELDNSDHAIGMKVACSRCAEVIEIRMDTAHPAFDLMMWRARTAKIEKRYMDAIASLAQGAEMFMAFYARFNFVDRPFARDTVRDRRRLEAVLDSFYDQTERMTFEPLRNLVLTSVTRELHPFTMDDAEPLAPKLQKFASRPPRSEIEGIQNDQLRELAIALADTDIGVRRNAIVHKYGYRPTLAEVDAYLASFPKLIRDLSSTLGITGADTLEWVLSEDSVATDPDDRSV